MTMIGKRAYVILARAIVAVALAIATVARADVPTQYRGLWCGGSKGYYRCRKATSEDYLHIRRDRINLSEEGDCRITAVTPIAKGHRLRVYCPPDVLPDPPEHVNLRLDARGRLVVVFVPVHQKGMMGAADIAWNCGGTIIGYADKDLGPSTAGSGPDGKPIGNDDLTTIWVVNPPRDGFVFKLYSTPHAYSTWSAELNGEPCKRKPWE
jgi:hypothetical protein